MTRTATMQRRNQVGETVSDGRTTRVYSGDRWCALPRYVEILENAAIANGWNVTGGVPLRRDSQGAYLRLQIGRIRPSDGKIIQFHLVWRIGLSGWGSVSAFRKIGDGPWETSRNLTEIKRQIEGDES